MPWGRRQEIRQEGGENKRNKIRKCFLKRKNNRKKTVWGNKCVCKVTGSMMMSSASNVRPTCGVEREQDRRSKSSKSLTKQKTL